MKELTIEQKAKLYDVIADHRSGIKFLDPVNVREGVNLYRYMFRIVNTDGKEFLGDTLEEVLDLFSKDKEAVADESVAMDSQILGAAPFLASILKSKGLYDQVEERAQKPLSEEEKDLGDNCSVTGW